MVTSLPVGLFGRYRESGVCDSLYPCSLGIIELKLEGETKCKLYPCYRKADNVAGMYDIVNDVFYTNAGTGDFIIGANI